MYKRQGIFKINSLVAVITLKKFHLIFFYRLHFAIICKRLANGLQRKIVQGSYWLTNRKSGSIWIVKMSHSFNLNAKLKEFYGPGCIATIKLFLRRTLVRSAHYCTSCNQPENQKLAY